MKLKTSIITRLAALLAGAAVFTSGSAHAAVHNYFVGNTSDGGTGSLREAMLLAIAGSENGPATDEHVIRFAINPSGVPHSIRPVTNLPVITAPITIDGTTQGGYIGQPLIEVSGGSGATTGFELGGATLTVRGLAINRFPYYGIASRSEPTIKASGLIMTGCHVGVDVTGTVDAGNGLDGINLYAKFSVQIGDTGANQGNVISGNGHSGAYIFPLNTSASYTFVNNRIGTNKAGTAAIPNEWNGAEIINNGFDYFPNVVVGGAGAARNIFSGNGLYGLSFWGGYFKAVVRNNIVGLGSDGSTLIPNGSGGISAEPVAVDIGGPAQTDGNIISGNGGPGMRWFTWFYEYLPAGIPAAQLRNNLIGTNAAGTAARPNALGGIVVEDHSFSAGAPPSPISSSVFAPIGAAGMGNVIAGNNGHGITVSGNSAMILGNFIGVTRSVAVLANSGSGIRVIDSEVQAGLAPNVANGNIIGGNTGSGINVTGASTLTAHGNFIGVSATGADIGNGSHGIVQGPWAGAEIMGITSIGGTGTGMGNTIAYNNGDGVALTEPFAIGARFLSILGNSIYANTGLGIDLGNDGITLNDAGDTDLGANRRQNFPVLLAATPTRIAGSLSSTPGTQFRIEFFRAEADGGITYGEGRTYLGSINATSDPSGLATFGLTGLSLTAGQFVTATASVVGAHPDPENADQVIQDTSEFAQNITVSSTEIATVGFASSAVSVHEGAGGVAMTFNRTGLTTGTSTVTYTAYSGTANIGTDLPAATGTITFTPGQTQRILTIPIANDTTKEFDETFNIFLTFPSGCLLQTPTMMTVTIIDNDPLPVLSVPATLSLVEGHSGDQTIEIPITLSAPAEVPILFYRQPNGGTATYSQDYLPDPDQSVTDEIHFAPGQTSYIARYSVKGDTTVEPDETFGLRLSFASNATIGGTGICTVTIVNDDDTSAGTFQFSSATWSAAENDGTATITVTRTGGSGGAATVNYGVVGGTASAGSDYVAATGAGALSFAHGQTSASFTISLVNDFVPESAETIQLQFLGVTGGTPGAPVAATLTITDSDAPGTLQFAAATSSVPENAGQATITVTRTGGTDGPASVNYSLAGGTATAGSDYVASGTAGTLNFANGQASASFSVILLDDSTSESAETLQFQLTNATSATLGAPATATLTITDNDVALTISGRVVKDDGTGITGVTLFLSGGQSATFTTDATGNYNFNGLVSGQSYTVTASASGWTFAPPSLTFPTMIASMVEQDFTGTPEAPPELSMEFLTDGRVILSWPAPSTGWILHSSTALTLNSWQPVTTTPIQRGGLNQVILTPSARAFFQLRKGTIGGGGGGGGGASGGGE